MGRNYQKAKYEARKSRRIDFIPPMPVKEKIERYGKGNNNAFVLGAVMEKIKRIEAEERSIGSVSSILS